MGKKKLVGRMALIVVGVGLVALAGFVATLLIENGERNSVAARESSQRRQLHERSRQYLDTVAQKVRKVPVDPAIVAEVQSAYFEELRQSRRYVWAMDNQGAFLFGVPSEAFARLNGLYDRFRPSIEKNGYASRQEFLRQLIQDNEEVDADGFEGASAPAEDGEEGNASPRWRLTREDDPRASVFSAPIKGEGGAVLGNLYMKFVNVAEPQEAELGHLRDVQDVFAGVLGFSCAFLWFLLPTWVYVDARERGMRRAGLWSFLVLISFIVGLAVYLIARPETPAALTCPSCTHEVNGGAFCPYCGHDLSGAFCLTCRYPLKSDWSFCPSCRAEIRPLTAATPVTEAPSAKP